MRKRSIRCRCGSLLLAVWLAVQLAAALPALAAESVQPNTPYKNFLPIVTVQQREARALVDLPL